MKKSVVNLATDVAPQQSNIKVKLTNVRRQEMSDNMQVYKGKDNLKDWLWQLTHNFKLSHVPKNEWVLVAGSYVQGFASTAYRTITRTTKGQSQITWPDLSNVGKRTLLKIIS